MNRTEICYNMITDMFENPKKLQLAHTISNISGLDIRTVVGISDVINNDTISDKVACKLLQPEFYTMNNVVRLFQSGLENLIPVSFYENKDFLIRTGISKIPNHFAQHNTNLESFVLQKQIKEIGSYAFDGAVNLKEITFLPERLDFGKAVFRDCINLNINNVNLDKTEINISEEMFKDCISLLSAGSIKCISSVGKKAFSGCLNLKQISINLTADGQIEDQAFNNCNTLEKAFIFPIKKIGENSFEDCVNLTDINLNNVCSFGKGALRHTGVKTISLSEQLDEIPEHCFCSCTELEQIYFQNGYGLHQIGKDAFFGCSKLQKISGKMYKFQFFKTSGAEDLKNYSLDFQNLGKEMDWI